MRRTACEELGNATKEVMGLAVTLSPPHSSLPFLSSPGGVSRPEGGVARHSWAVSVWPGLFAIRVCVAAPSSSCFPLLLSPLASSASLSLPPPPPLLPNSGSKDVSVAAPPPASCFPFSPASLVVFPYVCPLFSRVFSPLLGSDDLLCVPPPVLWTGVSSVSVLYG